MESTTITALTTFAALILVVGLIFGFVWLMKRLNDMPMQLSKHKRQRSINVLESRMLDPKNRLHHITWQGRDYLIASGPMGTRLVAGTAGEHLAPAASAESATSQTFADMVNMQDDTVVRTETGAKNVSDDASGDTSSNASAPPHGAQATSSHKNKGQTI